MLVFGRNTCTEVLKDINKRNKIKKIYLDKNFNDNYIISLIEKVKMDPFFTTKVALDELAMGNHQGIILDVGDYEYFDIDQLITDNGFIVMLDHLEDTHNFGAIIRTAKAAGVDGIIIPKDRSVSVNSTVMKTSSGMALSFKVCMVTNLVQTINYLKDKGYWIISSKMDGDSYLNVDYKDKVCLVIGNEEKGVSSLVQKSSDYLVSIPMDSDVDSLNASVAAGILMYEVVRQRK